MPNYQNIAITEVPPGWRVPGAWVQVVPNYSQVGLFNFPARVLLIGQMVSSGAYGAAGQVYQLQNAQQAAYLFGTGSIGHLMALRFLAANPYVPVDIVCLADPSGGTAATATLTVAHAPTAAGTVIVNACGQQIPVTFDPTVASSTIATSAVLTVALYLPQLPFVPTGSGSSFTLTAKHKGVLGNDMFVSIPSWPGGTAPANLQMAATGAVQFTGGAGVPDITTLWPAIANTWYTDIACAFHDATNLAALATELSRRYQAMTRLDATGYVAINASYGSLPALNTVNEPRLAILGSYGAYSPTWEWAASLAGVASYASLLDPAKQFRGQTLPGIAGPDPANAFTIAEQNLLLQDGFSTFDVRRDGTVAIQRLISSSTTNVAGYPDAAWLDITREKVMTRVRYDWRAYTDTVWGAAKLTDDNSLAAEYDPAIATPSRVKASWVARSTLYEQNGWLENTATLGKQAVFERDPNDPNKLLAQLPTQIVGNVIVQADLLTFQA